MPLVHPSPEVSTYRWSGFRRSLGSWETLLIPIHPKELRWEMLEVIRAELARPVVRAVARSHVKSKCCKSIFSLRFYTTYFKWRTHISTKLSVYANMNTLRVYRQRGFSLRSKGAHEIMWRWHVKIQNMAKFSRKIAFPIGTRGQKRSNFSKMPYISRSSPVVQKLEQLEQNRKSILKFIRRATDVSI